MADTTFNTTSGAPINREMLILCLNTGTSSTPVWSRIGKRVEDSSIEFDWQTESMTDILGQTYTNARKPILTQTFEPCDLDAGDAAQLRVWNDAVRDHDPSKVVNYDCLVVHAYAGTATSAVTAERYTACAITPTSLGGEGGGFIGMPLDVTYGGTRTLGTASIATDGTITFTAA